MQAARWLNFCYEPAVSFRGILQKMSVFRMSAETNREINKTGVCRITPAGINPSVQESGVIQGQNRQVQMLQMFRLPQNWTYSCEFQ